MNTIKTAILDVTGGLFLGKLAETVVPHPGHMSTATAPKYLFETAAETALLSVGAMQYMKWRNSFGFSGRDAVPLFFVLALYVTSSNYIKRLRSVANWAQSLIGTEINFFSASGTTSASIGASSGMTTQTQPQTGYDQGTGPNDHVNNDLLSVPFQAIDSV